MHMNAQECVWEKLHHLWEKTTLHPANTGLLALTSGVHSRGGKQNFKDKWCAWKRVSKDGKHYRILEHTTGYYYQEGFLPSQTEEPEADEDEDEEDKEGANEGDDGEEEDRRRRSPQAPSQEAEGRQGSCCSCCGT